MASSHELMQSFFKKKIKSFIKTFGFKIIRNNNFLDRRSDLIVEATNFDLTLINQIEEYALATKLNLWSIIQSLKYIYNNKIKGDIVECGVFRGGSLSLLCFYAQKLNINCNIWGYDTFEDGFLINEFSSFDKDSKNNSLDLKNFTNPKDLYYSKKKVLEVIKKFLITDNYYPKLIKGNIMETLLEKKNLPKNICFLRMDTDLYKTTKLQLEILYPKLVVGGVLHIDDYGHCPGVKKAVDEFFKNQNIWMHRVDYTCRYLIKK
jgi:O-methyltransferase